MRYVVKVSMPPTPYAAWPFAELRGVVLPLNEYLSALRPDSTRHETTPNAEDAFVFQTLTAAEIAACFVGGTVEEYTSSE